MAQTSLDQAKLNLANGVLLAPFDGVVAASAPTRASRWGPPPIITLVDPAGGAN